jgi:predicted GNAT superfamily acetyltransferase
MSFDRKRAGDLVLALMQLTLHEERRTWKSFDWDVMDDLFERGFITNPHSKAKSVVLTDEGLVRSREMYMKYLESAV